MVAALFTAKPVNDPFREAVEYTSRRTGVRYVLEDSAVGWIIQATDTLIFAGSKVVALAMIELADLKHPTG